MTSPRIAGGAPIIQGTRIAVRAIAGYYQLGMSVDEILQSLPHLTQSQVHAALTFYFDHQLEIDRDLRRNSDVNYWRKQVKQSPSVAARARLELVGDLVGSQPGARDASVNRRYLEEAVLADHGRARKNTR